VDFKLGQYQDFSALDPALNIRYRKTHEFDAREVGVSGVLLHVTPALLLSGFTLSRFTSRPRDSRVAGAAFVLMAVNSIPSQTPLQPF